LPALPPCSVASPLTLRVKEFVMLIFALAFWPISTSWPKMVPQLPGAWLASWRCSIWSVAFWVPLVKAS